jgi:large subunit ribosomal protein L10
MPTQKKMEQVEHLKRIFSESSIAVATGYQGLPASVMTSFRKHLRQFGVEYLVVKNNLAIRASQEIGKERMQEILEGPTGIAFGNGDDVVAVAKAVSDFISNNRLPVAIHGALMGSDILTSEDVLALANLPPKEELVSRMLGQMKAPMSGLVSVLNGVVVGLAVVLQRRVEQLDSV